MGTAKDWPFRLITSYTVLNEWRYKKNFRLILHITNKNWLYTYILKENNYVMYMNCIKTSVILYQIFCSSHIPHARREDFVSFIPFNPIAHMYIGKCLHSRTTFLNEWFPECKQHVYFKQYSFIFRKIIKINSNGGNLNGEGKNVLYGGEGKLKSSGNAFTATYHWLMCKFVLNSFWKMAT